MPILPLEEHTSQSRLDREQELIFSYIWTCAGFAEGTSEPGQHVSVTPGSTTLHRHGPGPTAAGLPEHLPQPGNAGTPRCRLGPAGHRPSLPRLGLRPGGHSYRLPRSPSKFPCADLGGVASAEEGVEGKIVVEN